MLLLVFSVCVLVLIFIRKFLRFLSFLNFFFLKLFSYPFFNFQLLCSSTKGLWSHRSVSDTPQKLCQRAILALIFSTKRYSFRFSYVFIFTQKIRYETYFLPLHLKKIFLSFFSSSKSIFISLSLICLYVILVFVGPPPPICYIYVYRCFMSQ